MQGTILYRCELMADYDRNLKEYILQLGSFFRELQSKMLFIPSYFMNRQHMFCELLPPGTAHRTLPIGAWPSNRLRMGVVTGAGIVLTSQLHRHLPRLQ